MFYLDYKFLKKVTSLIPSIMRLHHCPLRPIHLVIEGSLITTHLKGLVEEFDRH